jgi:hypothetical protein
VRFLPCPTTDSQGFTGKHDVEGKQFHFWRKRIMRLFRLSILLFVLIPLVVSWGSSYRDQRLRDSAMVRRQYGSDIERKREILRRIQSFIGDVNRRLGEQSKTRIVNPVDPDYIEDAEETDHFHSTRKIPLREFVYINGEGVILRIEDDVRSSAIGRLKSGERVELLGRSEHMDSVDGFKNYWYMIRNRRQDEGWIFGRYVQKNRPRGGGQTDNRDQSSPDRFLVPVLGKETSRFGYRIDPITKRRRSFHSGIDIAAPAGTPVRTCADGIVKIAEYMRNGYGKLVVIEHEEELSSYYGHLSKIQVRRGDRVRRGEPIGSVGATGRATGPHLHFEVRRGETALDPDAFLR